MEYCKSVEWLICHFEYILFLIREGSLFYLFLAHHNTQKHQYSMYFNVQIIFMIMYFVAAHNKP